MAGQLLETPATRRQVNHHNRCPQRLGFTVFTVLNATLPFWHFHQTEEAFVASVAT
jgi:hypothetical protein